MPFIRETISSWNLEVNEPKKHLSDAKHIMARIFGIPYYKGEWIDGRNTYNFDPQSGTVRVTYGSDALRVMEEFVLQDDFFSYRTGISAYGRKIKGPEAKVFGQIETNPTEMELALEKLYHIEHTMPRLLMEEMYSISQRSPSSKLPNQRALVLIA